MDAGTPRGGKRTGWTIAAAGVALSMALAGCGQDDDSRAVHAPGSPPVVATPTLSKAPTTVPSVSARPSIPPSASPTPRPVLSPATKLPGRPTLDMATSPVTSAMLGKTYQPGCPVGPGQLTRVQLNHYGFDGKIHRGEIIIAKSAVPTVRRVFTTALDERFPIRQMVNPDRFASDDAQMEADNTSGFWCRKVAGKNSWSAHSYGRAIDINPRENPYQKPDGRWYPASGRSYVNRSNVRPGMLTSSSPVVRAFKSQGWRWLAGFDWQHFDRR